jgi:GNAT superfamily N-acetyltransferase
MTAPVGGLTLRPAVAVDQDVLRQMVRAEQLDPTALHWSHFVVAELPGEGIVGIGQVRPSPNCRELGSMVVRRGHQRKGIGGAIIREILSHEAGPVFLETEIGNVAYYSRFGFVQIPWHQTPMPLKAKSAIGGLLAPLFGYRLATMRWDRVESG